MINVGSDYSEVGAFDQALKKLNIDYNTVFACDWDKYARQTYIDNYGNPYYFPKDVHDRKIPDESLDVYMSSPPCQSFSYAGKRGGQNDERGILFYNTHEFIKKNNPRYFIIENVKGLSSDDSGRTFKTWINYLGGKSVNGIPVIFPHEQSLDYHVYHKVLNAKHYGVPQNRERVFIIGIRDDVDNIFQFPKPMHLSKRLKDVLEDNVDEKYYLSDKMVSGLNKKNNQDNGFTFKPKTPQDTSNCVTARYYKMGADDNYLQVNAGRIIGRNPDNPKNRTVGLDTEQMLEVNNLGTSNAVTTVQKDNVVVYKPKNVEQINPSKESNGVQPYTHNRIYKGDIVGTLDTECGRPNYVVDSNKFIQGGLQNHQPKKYDGVVPCLNSAMGMGGGQTPVHNYDYKIRKLTPRECFRLMSFPDTFTWTVSNSQAYKQAGNSIVVDVLAAIISKLRK